MSGLFDARDSGNLARRNAAPGPPAGFGETLQSIWDDVSANNFSISENLVLFDEYDRYLDEIETATGQSFANPFGLAERDEPFVGATGQAFDDPFGLDRRHETFIPPDRAGQATLSRPRRRFRFKTGAERAVELLAEVTRLRDEKFPELRVRTPEDIRARAGLVRRAARERRAAVAARETTFGQQGFAFLAQAGTLMLDPLVLASLPFGAPWASGVLRAALVDAGIAAAVEVPIQASVQAARARFGERTSFSEAALNVLTVGAGGFLFSGLIRGGVKGTREVVRAVRGKGLAKTRPQRDALAYLERQIDLEDATPFNRDAPAARAEHERRLTEAQIAAREGRAPGAEEPRQPIRRPASAEGGTATPLSRVDGFEDGPLAEFETAIKAAAAQHRARALDEIAGTEAGNRLAGFVRAARDDAELTEFLTMLRKPPKPPRVTSLIQFLKEAGGIKDAGGDLKAMGLIRGRPGLINNKAGRDLDDAALIATEAGFFGGQGLGPQMGGGRARATVNELLEAIEQDFRGGVRRFNIEDEEALAVFDAASRSVDDILADLAEVGIDPARLGDAEAIARLRALAARGAPEPEGAAPGPEDAPGTLRGLSEARAERAGLEAFEARQAEFDAALERQVRADFEDRIGERVFLEDGSGEIRATTARAVFDDLDGDETLLREFRDCIGLGAIT